MTDVFLSYSSKDLDRVRLIRDALAERGFDVFWDQTLPAGIDWDTWIRQHLAQSKCALVVWSKNSVGSDNVRHEAKIAKDQRKLLPVLIDDLAAEEFPMGLYVFQAAQLAIWHGNTHDDAWLRVLREIEDKLMPLWAKQRIDQLEAQLDAERGRREATERRDRTLRDQIATEARTQADLKHERDRALEEIAAVKEQLANGTPRAGARQQFAAPSENARKARLGQWWEARSKTDRVIWVVLLSILFFFFLGFFLRFLAGK
jgi:hypothetical protein